MGCLVASTSFETISIFLKWVVKDCTQYPQVTHYLDDFLLVRPLATLACADNLATFQALAAELGGGGVPLVQDFYRGSLGTRQFT